MTLVVLRCHPLHLGCLIFIHIDNILVEEFRFSTFWPYRAQGLFHSIHEIGAAVLLGRPCRCASRGLLRLILLVVDSDVLFELLALLGDILV